ncbi:MAG: HAD family hydrolase [Acidobacteriota bacterium]|nr:HAD family hydrolase [Acidobacteriota bacterium]
MSRPAAVAVWDLDGTLYRSTEACRHYARGIAAGLAEDRRRAYLAALDDYLAGASGNVASDGWEAAVVLAGGPRGASRAYADAFARTRAFMLTDECALEVPEGLVELIEQRPAGTRQVLMSNTPAFGVMPLLERLGLLGLFDEIVCHAEKPERFAARLHALARVHDVPPAAVISIGDHFVNDIAPAFEVGCATAYVDPVRAGPAGRATFEAARVEELLPALAAWMAGERLAAVEA